MSGASPGAAWQRSDVANPFLDDRQILVPLLDVQEDLLRRLLGRHPRPLGRILDIGSGNGAMSELALATDPSAEAVLVDFSKPMLDRAAARLERFPGRWRVVEADLSMPAWCEYLRPAGYGVAISALAIHHLPGERKRALYGELAALLEPGGLFVNMDYVTVDSSLAGLFDEQLVANAVRAERERGGRRTAEEVEREFVDDGVEDRPDSVEDQLQWLCHAGLEHAELHFKWAEAAIFGAVKPPGADG
ncbi:MAG: class I SAM-dependent methyltransferase [Actinomycetota bacterium]|nr:class I SAM-dependent methyltransferase [Actinomycetota bacterium]